MPDPIPAVLVCPLCEEEGDRSCQLCSGTRKYRGLLIRRLPNPNRKRKSSDTKMTAEDNAWARAVKDRDGWACQWPGCARTRDNGGVGGIQAAHIFGRRKKGTRLLVDNGISLCGGHHFYAHGGGARDFILLAQDRLGAERFEELRQLSQPLKTVKRRLPSPKINP